MNFLGNELSNVAPNDRYAPLGYRNNPFPKQGQVDGDIYVPRKELEDLERDLTLFLQGRPQGSVWAVQGAIGYGKSNFLKAVDRGIREAVERQKVTGTACRFVPSLSLTPRRIVEEILLGIGEDTIGSLIEFQPRAKMPDQLNATDFGRFWSNLSAASPHTASQFLMRWLGGQQTYKQERETFGITARDRLPPAVAFPYLKALLDMFDDSGLLKRIVLLLDEFEDIERLTKSNQTEYVQVLKTLLNAFNWRGLYVVIAGQAAAFTTIGENYPSLASRWRSVSLQPVQTPDEAVSLASAYEKAAALNAQKATKLVPSEVDIKSIFINMYEKQRTVSQRMLLTALHEWVEQAAENAK
jgi:hypothetical protein